MRDMSKEGCNFAPENIGSADGSETWVGAGSLEKSCPGVEASPRAASASLISNPVEKCVRESVGEFVAVATLP